MLLNIVLLGLIVFGVAWFYNHAKKATEKQDELLDTVVPLVEKKPVEIVLKPEVKKQIEKRRVPRAKKVTKVDSGADSTDLGEQNLS